MGNNRYDNDSYRSVADTYVGKTQDDVFVNNKTQTVDADMNPQGLKFRESRDSDLHPNSVAVMVMLDVTGSMGRVPEILVREKLGTLMNTLIDHGVPDSHVLFGAIGDHISDQAPLQVGQFEAGAEQLLKWLTGMYLEGRGGGQAMESYLLAWLIAGRHTSIDCYEKRGKKGFLFTIGDEASHPNLHPNAVKELLGYTPEMILTDKQLLEEARRLYHVYHIHIDHHNGYEAGDRRSINDYWHEMLGEHCIKVSDLDSIAGIISTIVALEETDKDVNTITNGMSEALTVINSVKHLVKSTIKDSPIIDMK